MLPSMPLLMTPVKQINEDSSDTSDDSSPQHTVEAEQVPQTTNRTSSAAVSGESEQLQSSAARSSCDLGTQGDGDDKVTDKPHTPEKRNSCEPLSSQKKKKKTHHLKTIAALTPDRGPSLDNSAQNFAEAYFQKVKSLLDCEKWNQFLQELVDFEARPDKQPVELFRHMEQLLSPHSQLVEEFLVFLRPEQALEVNRFIPYLLLCKMKEFFRKLNILLMKRQARQVMAALEALAVQPNVTLADVRSSVLPLLKSSPLLTSHFLEMLPGERPPDSLMTEFEKVDLKDDSAFETVVVPDCPDPYGNENCVCPCHAGQKTRHCVRCGIKYLNGRVYLQYGKALRPAKVTFKGNKHMDFSKWEDDKLRPRRRFPPKTMLSPSCHDQRLNADSEDDCGVKKSPRTPKIRPVRPKVTKKSANENKEEEVLEGIFPLTESKNKIISSNMMGELAVDCKMNLDGNDENEFDDVVIEGECNTEEDEEEDKCLHSENESSIEAEDICKELEIGIDFSFEDDEVEDIESTEVMQNEMSKARLEDHFEETFNEQLVIKMETSSVELEKDRIGNEINSAVDPHRQSLKSSTIEEDPISPVKVEAIEAYEDNSSITDHGGKSCLEDKSEGEITVGNNPCSTSEVKSEPLCDTESKVLNVSAASSNGCEMERESSGKVNSSDGVDSAGKEWTREEDTIILQTIQSENGLEQAFETSKLQLPNRSKEEIQTRFDFVLKLLKEMISDESNS